jgi:predicted SAM-dependent methyltransferase
MKVLEIGPGPKPQAQDVWPEAELITIDANPEAKATYQIDARTAPEELYGQFDHILASHVLEHFPWHQTTTVLKEWGKMLAPGGDLNIVVPSLEWAARQILSEHPSPATIPHLYAGVVNAWDVHLAGFTMRHLRVIMESSGYRVTLARSGPYTIMAKGSPYQAEQHFIKGVLI